MSLTDISFHLFYNPAVFSPISKNILLCTVTCLLSALGIAQTAAPATENTPKSSDPDWSRAGESSAGFANGASNTLVAPDQAHRAYAETEATAPYPQTWRLFQPSVRQQLQTVRRRYRRFRGALSAGTRGCRERKLPAPGDWSADGRRLRVAGMAVRTTGSEPKRPGIR
jgi:hypothetical protein